MYEDSIDVTTSSCQTDAPPAAVTSGVQTEPLDDPPSYAESSGPAKPPTEHTAFSFTAEIEGCNRRLLQACYSLPITSGILQRVPDQWHPFFINVLTAVLVLSSPAFLFGWTCGFAAARWYATNVLWLAVDTYETARDLGPTNQISFLLRESVTCCSCCLRCMSS